MSEYKIGSVVFNPAPHAAAPQVPTGYQGKLVGCGDGDTRIVDVAGLEREIALLPSEIALRDRAVQWCLHNGARLEYVQQNWNDQTGQYDYEWELRSDVDVPADLAAIIRGKQQADGGQS